MSVYERRVGRPTDRAHQSIGRTNADAARIQARGIVVLHDAVSQRR
jgi:hypothetical protein